METKQLKLVFPSGNFHKVLEGIAQGIGVENEEQIDLTQPENAHQASIYALKNSKSY